MSLEGPTVAEFASSLASEPSVGEVFGSPVNASRSSWQLVSPSRSRDGVARKRTAASVRICEVMDRISCLLASGMLTIIFGFLRAIRLSMSPRTYLQNISSSGDIFSPRVAGGGD